MTYTLTAREEGKKVLVEVSFTDNGGSSEGPLVSVLYPSTQSQTVDPNNPPTASDGTVTTVEDTVYTFMAANFSYADTDNDPLVSVKIIELPVAGTGALTLGGTVITSANPPKTVTATELTGGGLKYAPPANANGAGYASFKFKLNDGTADSASEYFMMINVTPVNDPATGAPAISGTAHVGLTLTASTAGIADLDGVSSSFTYQWIRVDDDGTSNAANIGADSSAYTLTAAEEGKKVLVEVSFTDKRRQQRGAAGQRRLPVQRDGGKPDGIVRRDYLHGHRERHDLSYRPPERGPGAHGRHSHHGDAPGHHDHRRLHRADQRDLRRGRHVEDDHLHGGPGRGG